MPGEPEVGERGQHPHQRLHKVGQDPVRVAGLSPDIPARLEEGPYPGVLATCPCPPLQEPLLLGFVEVSFQGLSNFRRTMQGWGWGGG